MAAVCSNCGRALGTAETFCPNCGAKISETAEEAAAVAAEIVGFDPFSSSLSPEVLGELSERFLAAAEEIAAGRGGVVVSENPYAVTVKFSNNLELPAAAATSCAINLRETARELLAAFPGNLSEHAYFAAGIDAALKDAPPAGESQTPHAKARSLRRKAGKWAILAGESVYASTAQDVKYAPVGFYQARGGKKAVKIYELRGDRQPRASPPPVEKAPFLPAAGFEEAIANFFTTVISQNRSRTLFVKGAAGTGKTTWLSVACRLGREQGFRVYASSCVPRRRYQPFALWVPVWRSIFEDSPTPAALADAINSKLREIDGRAAIWAPLFLQILGSQAEPDPHVADVAPAFRHRRILEIAANLVTRAAREKPTAIILDDLHLSDASSRAMLGALLVAPVKAPLALVIASETPDDTLNQAADSTLSTRLFTEEEVAAFAGDFVETSAPETSAILHAATKGRPAVLAQIWLAAREMRGLNAKSLAAEGTLDIPLLVARRLHDFDNRRRRAAAVLATLGIPIRDEDLRALTSRVFGSDGTAGEAWRYKIYKLHLLRPFLGDAERLYVPPHLAEAILDATAPNQENRTAAAQAAADFLTGRYPQELWVRATLELEAGRLPTAFGLAMENVARARWFGSPHDAVAHLTAVIQRIEKEKGRADVDSAVLPRLFLARAEAFREAGLAAAALNDLEKSRAEEGEPAARRYYSQGQVYLRRGYFRESETAFLEALQRAARLGESGLVADAELALAQLFLQQGDISKATYELEKSVKANRATSAAAYQLLAELKYGAGYVADAVQAARKSISSIDASQTPIAAARAGLSLAPLIYENGRISEGRALIAEARAAFDVVNDKRGVCDTYVLEGKVELPIEDLATSENTFANALRLAEEENCDLCRAEAALGLCLVHLLRGDGAAHRSFLVKAKDADAAEPHAAQAGIDLAEAAAGLIAGDYKQACRSAAAAVEACRRTGDGYLYGAAVILAARAELKGGERGKCREIMARPEFQRRARESKLFFPNYNLAAGELMRAEGDFPRARKLLVAAAAAARELGLWLVQGECYLNIVGMASHKEDQREKYLRRALWLFERNGGAFLASRARTAMALY
jgi:class 3 adenylate cyclase/tetratricopeptide (TPR) repeat protein